jgi:hypothetical protein
MAKTKFPKELMVTREGEPHDNYLVAHENTGSIEDGVDVAVYQLVGTKRMKVTKELR